MTSRFKTTKKKVLFRLFIVVVIEWLLINYYFIISAITGGLNWTMTRLKTTVEGFIIQIIELAILILGVMIFLYIVVYIGRSIKGLE